jgi:1-acyl-sn-glycerol-3-phosphate acyltransferase
VAPEGTRAHTDHLKSGFYQIALAADLPIGLGYLDYARRCIGIDTYVRMTGDEDRDLATLRAFYADKRACIPEHVGELRFRPTPPSAREESSS